MKRLLDTLLIGNYAGVRVRIITPSDVVLRNDFFELCPDWPRIDGREPPLGCAICVNRAKHSTWYYSKE